MCGGPYRCDSPSLTTCLHPPRLATISWQGKGGMLLQPALLPWDIWCLPLSAAWCCCCRCPAATHHASLCGGQGHGEGQHGGAQAQQLGAAGSRGARGAAQRCQEVRSAATTATPLQELMLLILLLVWVTAATCEAQACTIGPAHGLHPDSAGTSSITGVYNKHASQITLQCKAAYLTAASGICAHHHGAAASWASSNRGPAMQDRVGSACCRRVHENGTTP